MHNLDLMYSYGAFDGIPKQKNCTANAVKRGLLKVGNTFANR